MSLYTYISDISGIKQISSFFKVKILVTTNSVKGLSIDNFLKIIDTIHMLIEVGRKFCSSESDSLQQSLKEQG